MIWGEIKSTSKFKKKKKIKLVQKVFFTNLTIHCSITPTHTGTKQNNTVVSHTQTILNFFYILFNFYDF